jgi:hypothetical protein
VELSSFLHGPEILFEKCIGYHAGPGRFHFPMVLEPFDLDRLWALYGNVESSQGLTVFIPGTYHENKGWGGGAGLKCPRLCTWIHHRNRPSDELAIIACTTTHHQNRPRDGVPVMVPELPPTGLGLMSITGTVPVIGISRWCRLLDFVPGPITGTVPLIACNRNAIGTVPRALPDGIRSPD